MYTVWFSDLEKVLKVFHEKLPHVVTFCSLGGNAYGDFLIKTDMATYCVRPSDLSVWRLDKNNKNCHWGEWVKVE